MGEVLDEDRSPATAGEHACALPTLQFFVRLFRQVQIVAPCVGLGGPQTRGLIETDFHPDPVIDGDDPVRRDILELVSGC